MRNDMRIVLFNGPPGSGKDTAANYILRHCGEYTIKRSLATPLYNAVREVFCISYERWKWILKHKNIPMPEFMQQTLRDVLISLGEKWIKAECGKQHLVNVLLRSIDDVMARVILVPDIGFQEELSAMCKAFQNTPKVSGRTSNLLLVHLQRPGCDFTNDSRSYVHDPRVKTVTINNAFDLEMFHAQIIRDIIPFVEGT